jgi:hypothetical protein
METPSSTEATIEEECIVATNLTDLLFEKDSVLKDIEAAKTGRDLRLVLEKLPKSRDRCGFSLTFIRVLKVHIK